MRPLPWQVRFLRGLSRPDVTTAALSVARSNGKSWLAARLATDYLLGDRRDSEAVIVASSYTQAKVIFRYALAMAREAGHDPTDRGAWWYRDSVTTALLRSRETGQAIRALGCDPKRAHGRVFGLALMDEPAQWPPGSRDAMLSAIDTGAGKVEGSRIVALGTRPDSPEHWFQRWLDGGADYAQVHAARVGDPPFWLKTIRRANPSFDYLPALRADLVRQRDRARVDVDARARFEALALNMGVPDTAEAVLIEREAWERCESDRLPDRTGPYVLGLDIGQSGAMTAAAAYWPGTGRLEGLAVVGGIPDLRERGRRDNVAGLYVNMARRRELLVHVGLRVPDYGQFIDDVLGRWGVPSVIVGDRYKEAELRDALDAGRMPRRSLVIRGQGWRDGAEDVRRFRRAVAQGRIRAPRSLLIRAALSEARVATDVAGNAKLAKGTEAGRRKLARDDVASAAIMAVAEADRRGVLSLDRPRLVAL
ncbi:MAG: hypothetical protein F4087_12225 [Gemmatimonadetes bacterium]|nr:hypothetical protein [Gemmatimonadota bacterium]MYJ69259.1 hypothetical protein [Gemmatimonadota bacterium]